MERKELHEGSNGGVGVWAEGIDGEGVAEVFGEGVDESCDKVGWGQVGFKISWEDVGEYGELVEGDAVDLNQEVARDWWGCPKGGAETVAAVDEGTVGVEEGDECSLDIVESWWVGGLGRNDIAMRQGHDGVGGAEDFAGLR